VPHLLSDCLFEIPHGSGLGHQTTNKPICKSLNSRTAALKLLTVLSRDSLENLQMVLSYIREFSHEASWRTNKLNDWQITYLDDEKSSTGYAGLKNLGCICYMISLFQQLFMVPSFRDDLLAVDDPNHENQPADENMFHQLQAIFSGLLKSEKQYVNPKGFCHAFKDWEGQPTNVLEQMDVEEFLQMFLDRLETAIKGTPQEKTIQAHFGGKFASEMICKGCPHQFERPEPFLSIGVTVKNKRSL
jgi:ubiquitin carboxyl-terminal hydrolase 9/24